MTMTDDKELLPCPFCGSANVDPTYSLGSRSDGTHVHAAGCDVCGAVGPDTPDDSKIGEAWNRRAPPAAVESQERRQAEWGALSKVLDEYTDYYELRGEDESGRDGIYSPSDQERLMLRDYIEGLLADETFIATFSQCYPVRSRFANKTTAQPLEAEAAMLKVCRLADRVVARIGMLGNITSDDEHVVALLQALKELDPNAVIQSDPVPWMQRAGAVCT